MLYSTRFDSILRVSLLTVVKMAKVGRPRKKGGSKAQRILRAFWRSQYRKRIKKKKRKKRRSRT